MASGGSRGPLAGKPAATQLNAQVPAKGHPAAKPAAHPAAKATKQAPSNGLASQANAIADAQVNGPVSELAAQIARNNTQGTAAEDRTFGYFKQLAQDVHDSMNRTDAIGAGLNSTLTGNAWQTAGAIQGFGQNAAGGALANMGSLGLDGGGLANVQGETARQQGVGQLNAGVFRDSGAIQGANYSSDAAANLGTYALRGQERLGDIARATRLQNVPLSSKQAALIASKGALRASALGKLKQQDFTNKVTLAGLGLRQDQLGITAQNNRANQNIKVAAIKSANARSAASLAQSNLNNLRTNQTSAANNAASNATRRLVSSMRGNGKTGKGASPQQSNTIYAHIDYLSSELNFLISKGYSPQSAYHVLENGGKATFSGGSKTYQPNKFGVSFLNAAYNARSGGDGLSKGDVAWLHSLGVSARRYPIGGGILSSNPLAHITF